MTVPIAPPMTGTPGRNGNRPPAPPFDKSTRLSFVPLATITRPAGGGLSPEVPLPSNGLLAGAHVVIRGSVSGTVGTVPALGFAAVLRRLTFRLNSGTVIWSLTGPDYHYLYRDFIDSGYVDVCSQTNARDPVTATNFVLDMVVPLMVNERDPIGLLLLQNRQTTLTMLIEWETDANITSTGTMGTTTASVELLSFSVPTNPDSLPPLRWLHLTTDESRVVGGAGDVTYDIPRGNTYLGIYHGAGIGATGADSWSRAAMRVNQTQYIFDFSPNQMEALFRRQTGRARELGAIAFDFAGTSGLGRYGTTRDLYDSNRTTDFQTVTTVTGPLTFYTVRDQLVDLYAA